MWSKRKRIKSERENKERESERRDWTGVQGLEESIERGNRRYLETNVTTDRSGSCNNRISAPPIYFNLGASLSYSVFIFSLYLSFLVPSLSHFLTFYIMSLLFKTLLPLQQRRRRCPSQPLRARCWRHCPSQHLRALWPWLSPPIWCLLLFSLFWSLSMLSLHRRLYSSNVLYRLLNPWVKKV